MITFLLLGAFFLSGYCALSYEIAWTRLLQHVFGVSVFATTTVLAAFMGGLAIGALLAGHRADAAREPLYAYALTELAIALCAFSTPTIFAQLEPAYGWMLRTLHEAPVLLTVARTGLSVAALIIPASLIGATFPLMTRSLVRKGRSAGRDLGLLYGMNTLGGVAGCLSVGFALLGRLGTSRTIYLAGLINLVVAALALIVGRWRCEGAGATNRRVVDAAHQSPSLLPGTATVLLILAVFVSGFISLAHEVVWFRGLLAYLYNSTYAFSLMLAIFLFGLGLGGMIYAALPAQLRASLAFVGALTMLVGAGFWVSSLIFPHLNAYARAILGLRGVDSWETGVALIAVECALILLAPATLLGMTFPASLHVLTSAGPRSNSRIAQLYSLNTLGGIAGSLAAGFVMIPLLGMRGSLVVLVLSQIALGLAIIASTGRMAVIVPSLSAAVLVPVFLPLPPARMFVDAMNAFPWATRVIFYREGRTDSTAVLESMQTRDRIVVYSDGRGAAGTAVAPLQKFFGHLAMLLHPQPARVLNIGFGVGNSMSAIIKHDPARLDCVELSEHVSLTAPFFWTNDQVLDDPRVHLIVEDGAVYVRHTDQLYDVISLEPPEVFTSTVVNLYTREFYQAAARVLERGGMLEQWFTPSLMAEPELKMLLRTLMSVFPYTVVFAQLDWSNYVAVGSLQPIHLDLDVLRGWWRRPRIADHLRSIGVESPEELLSYLVAGQERLWEYVGRDGPVVTDDHTYVDFVIPRSGAAGFGFGIYNPAQRAPFLRRQAEDWAVVDRLQAAEPLGPLLRSADGAASFQEQVDRLRAMRRLARVDELPWARVGVHAEADRPEN